MSKNKFLERKKRKKRKEKKLQEKGFAPADILKILNYLSADVLLFHGNNTIHSHMSFVFSNVQFLCFLNFFFLIKLRKSKENVW